MRICRDTTRARPSIRRPWIRRALPRIEELESRVVPYSVTGNAWPNPQLITISFMPDGTNLGGVTSNLFATFNAKWSTSTWENQILKAAQLWAQQTNINFSVIPDSGADQGSGNYQQGDPTMGDIRIGGYNFGSSTLAEAMLPPPVNNYSVAGDVLFNTGQTFNIGSTYDLLTVAAHEMGHALGLGESSATAAVMFGYYNATKSSLNSDDISGIRNIYSSNNPRSYDAFNGANNSFSAATNLTGLIDANSTVLETGLNLNTSQKEYFTLTAPASTTGTMTVTVQSSGLSMLAPTLTVYNASQTQIGYVSGAGQYGTTLTLNITGVSAGQQFYAKVAGADSTAFGTGAYALTFAFAGIAPPAVPLPNTQVLNGSPIQGGGGLAEEGGDSHGKETARDTFGQTDDQDGTPAKAQTPVITATGYLPSVSTPHGMELASVPTAIVNPVPTPGFAAVPLRAFFLISSASTPATTLVPQHDAGGVENGGGNYSAEGALEENPTEQPAPPATETIAPVSPVDAQRSESASEQTGVTSVSWRQANDACFVEEAPMIYTRGTREDTLVASADGVSTPIEPEAVAMLALLGGWWCAYPEPADQRRMSRG